MNESMKRRAVDQAVEITVAALSGNTANLESRIDGDGGAYVGDFVGAVFDKLAELYDRS